MTEQTYPNITMSCIVSPDSKVETILKDAPLRVAVKTMSKTGYSQLPVLHKDGDQKLRKGNVVGLLSWREVCDAMVFKDFDQSQPVSKFMDCSHQWCECRDTALVRDVVGELLATDREYALVVDEQQMVCGLTTYYDVAKLYDRMVAPFSLIESIEAALRKRLGTLAPEEIGAVEVSRRQDLGEDIQTISKGVNDLEFSEYQGLINKFWNQLDFSCRLDDLNEVLPKVNKIRNRVMHFRPEGVSDEDRIELEWLRKLLR